MLTAKQEKFVRNLIQGMSQREAYKNSYDAENMTDKTIDEEACRLFNDSKISARYRELQDRLDKATIMTAQERLEYLTEVIQGIQREQVVQIVEGEAIEVEVPTSIKNRLSAIDLMNKMQGEYVTKVEADVNSEVNITIELSDD
jgi:phage terminase small subunit